MEAYLDIFGHLPTLETDRLLIRPARIADAQDMFEYSRDPEVARHVLWDAHTSVHQTRQYIRFLLRQYRLCAPASVVIEHKETGRVIGTIGFMWIQMDNRSGEVGYSLSRAFWNQGLMTEALAAMLEFGFDQLHLNRIEAQHECANPASGRVMQKVGMRREGTLRQRLYNKGRFVDVDLYAILRGDPRPMGQTPVPSPRHARLTPLVGR